MREESKRKVNYLVNLSLRQFELPFTYTDVTVERCAYYGPNDYDIELLFHGYNGGKYPHRNRIFCMHGNCDQTMYLDMGFPSAALCFDRVKIPYEAVKLLAKAAYYDTKLSEKEKGSTK